MISISNVLKCDCVVLLLLYEKKKVKWQRKALKMTSSKFNKQQRKIHPLTLFFAFSMHGGKKKENKIFTIKQQQQQQNLHS